MKNWRSKTQKRLNLLGYQHFKFQPSKIILIVKGKTKTPLVGGEAFYKNFMCILQSLCKQGKYFSSEPKGIWKLEYLLKIRNKLQQGYYKNTMASIFQKRIPKCKDEETYEEERKS